MYEQNSFEPVARVVQLSEILEKQRIDNAVTHVWQYVPSGIVTQDVLDNVEKAKQPLVKIYHYHNNHLGTPQELKMRYAKDTLTLYYKQEKHTLTSDNEKIYDEYNFQIYHSKNSTLKFLIECF